MRRRLALWFALVLVIAACAGDPEPPAPPVPSQLDFALPALDGGEVVGVQLAGQHLALWFWTPW